MADKHTLIRLNLNRRSSDLDVDEIAEMTDRAVAEGERAMGLLDAFMEGRGIVHINDSAPLKLEDAIHLPELGGEWTRNPKYRRPSPTYTVRKLRQEIERGALKAIKRGKNLFVTRAAIKEFVEWQDPANQPASSCAKPAKSAPESVRRYGSSSTPELKSARDAALTMLKRQRNS